MSLRAVRSLQSLTGRAQTAVLGAFVALTLAAPAFAGTTGGTAMPWETPAANDPGFLVRSGGQGDRHHRHRR